MKDSIKLILVIVLLINYNISYSQEFGTYNAIYSGVPWFDDRGEVVSAHEDCCAGIAFFFLLRF